MEHLKKPQALLALSPQELALHLRQVAKQHSAPDVARQLLSTIEQEALPPFVWTVVLSAFDSVALLRNGICQQFSRFIRRTTTQQFGKLLQGTKWLKAWDALGGKQGLLEILAQSSVSDVAALCKVIGACTKSSEKSITDKKRKCITEFFRVLVPSLTENQIPLNGDKRPLQAYYAKLIPACTTETIQEIVCSGKDSLWKGIPKRNLQLSDFQWIRECVLQVIDGEDSMLRETEINDDFADVLLSSYVPDLCASCPSGQGSEPRFSASMSFSLDLLQHLINRNQAMLSGTDLLHHVVHPLLRRMVRKRVHISRQHQVFGMILQVLELVDHQALTFSSKIMLYIVAQWSYSPDLFEQQLISVLKMCPFTQISDLPCDLIKKVKKAHRYEFLHILFMHAFKPNLDLSVEADLRTLEPDTWPATLFLSLHEDQAIELMERILATKENDVVVRYHGTKSILLWPVSTEITVRDTTDPYLLLAFLKSKDDPGSQELKNIIKEKRELAAKSRDQRERVFYARSAAYYAIASHSPELYYQVITWNKRFLRDTFTLKEIYSSDTVATKEGIALLSGIPLRQLCTGVDQVTERVSMGNHTLLELVSQGAAALSEPSFSTLDWVVCFQLLFSVVKHRVAKAGILKDALNLSEDQLYEVLWVGTLALLLEVERIAIREGNERLELGGPHGPVCIDGCYSMDVEPALPSTFRFVDELAKARNDIWTKLRRDRIPATIMIKPPWPRGLPLQCLIGPFNVCNRSAFGKIPYIASRAEQIALVSPALALAEVDQDEDVRSAIGPFIDSFGLAWKICASQARNDEDAAFRRKELISHASNELSDRLKKREVGPFWRSVFKRSMYQGILTSLPDEAVEARKGNYGPVIPQNVNTQEIVEWNPGSEIPSPLKSRSLQPLTLDSLLGASSRISQHWKPAFPTLEPSTSDIEQLDIWSSSRLQNLDRLPIQIQEGLVVSALLFLAHLVNYDSKLLSNPFPSQSRTRYPALYLDHEFFGIVDPKQEACHRSAKKVINRLGKLVPTTLLFNLVEAAHKHLLVLPKDSPEITQTKSLTFSIAAMLIKSDRPQSVAGKVLQLILDFPDDSSWHRQLLTRAFIRHLSCASARGLVYAFAEGLKKRIEMQHGHNAHVDGDESKSKLPSIKVTTIKHLVQLLDEANFISDEDSVQLLIEIFQASSHRDVRAAVLNSLLLRLQSSVETSQDLIECVLSAIENMVPLMSAPNEQESTVSVNWNKVRESGKLPEVYMEDDSQTLAPLAQAVLGLIDRQYSTYQISSSMRTDILKRVVIPMVRASATNNSQWVAAFLQKHAPEVDPQSLPRFPFKRRQLNCLVTTFSTTVPGDLVDLWHDYAKFLLILPSDIEALNRKITADTSLRRSNEGKHWLSLYGGGDSQCTDHIASMCNYMTDHHSASDSRTPIESAQIIVTDLFKTLISSPDFSLSQWNIALDYSTPPLSCYWDEYQRKNWLEWIKPILQDLVTTIDSMRTPEWQENPNRSPKLLPDTFSIKLHLLDNPVMNQEQSPEQRCQKFASQLVEAINHVIALGFAHHPKLKNIEAVTNTLNAPDRARVACEVERLEPGSGSTGVQQHIIQVRLAEAMIWDLRMRPGLNEWSYGVREDRSTDLSQDKDEGLRRELKEMIERWKASSVEEIRMSGMQASTQLGFEP